MSGVLDIVALRSLASIADSGGFRRAADSLHLSQSAISQHVRRLEQACGQVLMERDVRGARFTAAGHHLVADARKILAAHDDALNRLRGSVFREKTIVIGSTEHAADVLLPAITDQLQHSYPDHSLRFRIDRGSVLRERIEQGSVDAAVLLGPGEGAHTRPAGALALGWYAAPDWKPPRRSAPGGLPLVVIDGPCTIRRRAVQALTDRDIRHSIVCEAGHLAGVLQAARAGVGVALLVECGAPPDGLERRSDLPPVAAEPLHVRHRPGTPADLPRLMAAAITGTVAPGLPNR